MSHFPNSILARLLPPGIIDSPSGIPISPPVSGIPGAGGGPASGLPPSTGGLIPMPIMPRTNPQLNFQFSGQPPPILSGEDVDKGRFKYLPTQDPGRSSFMAVPAVAAGLVVLPAALKIIKFGLSAPAVGAALLGGGGRFGLVSKALTLLGGIQLVDLLDDLIPFIGGGSEQDVKDAITTVLTELDAGISSGAIMMPSHRSGTEYQANYFHINMDNGQAWITDQYRSANSVRSAVARERTQGFRGRGGRRQARTK